MEEYIEKLISQIRCKKARPYVADEIRGHMEDQIADAKTQIALLKTYFLLQQRKNS